MHLKECGLTTLETRRLRADQREALKLLNGYENINRNIFFSVKVFIYMVIVVVGRHCIDVAVVSYPITLTVIVRQRLPFSTVH